MGTEVRKVIKCQRYPLICNFQTGHSGKYCLGFWGINGKPCRDGKEVEEVFETDDEETK